MRLTLVLNVLLSIAVFAAVMIAGESLAHAQSCPAGTLYCDAGWCCPPGLNGATNVCCNDNPQSEGCTSNGVCGTTDGGNNDPTTCDGGSIPTQDTCGEAQCSCAAPCSSGGDCSSGCCVEGYCALPCTCAEGTEVLLYCGTNDETTSSPGGCEASGVVAARSSYTVELGLTGAAAALLLAQWRRRAAFRRARGAR